MIASSALEFSLSVPPVEQKPGDYLAPQADLRRTEPYCTREDALVLRAHDPNAIASSLWVSAHISCGWNWKMNIGMMTMILLTMHLEQFVIDKDLPVWTT
ncbi:hypothetical protein Tco_0178693 [Tanacetum coccineum]